MPVPTQHLTHTRHAPSWVGWRWGGGRAREPPRAEGVGTSLGSISTSHQQECPSCHGYSRAWLWAKTSLGRFPPPAFPPPPPSTHSGARRIPGAWWCAGSPRLQRRSPGGVSVPRGPRGPTWHQVGTGGPKGRRAGQGRGPGGGRRCSRAAPPLSARPGGGQPGGGGGLHGRGGQRERPQGLPSEGAESRGLNLRLGVLSPISPAAAAQCELWLWREKGGEKPIM